MEDQTAAVDTSSGRQPRYRVLHDQMYGTYEEANEERRRREAEGPGLRVRVRRLRAGYRLVVRERITEAAGK